MEIWVLSSGERFSPLLTYSVPQLAFQVEKFVHWLSFWRGNKVDQLSSLMHLGSLLLEVIFHLTYLSVWLHAYLSTRCTSSA